MGMFAVDPRRGVLVIRRGAVVTRNLKFDGKIIAGMNSNFFGDLEAEEVYLARGCAVGGVIRCDKVVVGAKSEFNTIVATDSVFVLKKCRGRRIFSEGDVKILGGCRIDEVYAAGNLFIEGNSKIEKMEARKILAYQD